NPVGDLNCGPARRGDGGVNTLWGRTTSGDPATKGVPPRTNPFTANLRVQPVLAILHGRSSPMETVIKWSNVFPHWGNAPVPAGEALVSSVREVPRGFARGAGAHVGDGLGRNPRGAQPEGDGGRKTHVRPALGLATGTVRKELRHFGADHVAAI